MSDWMIGIAIFVGVGVLNVWRQRQFNKEYERNEKFSSPDPTPSSYPARGVVLGKSLVINLKTANALVLGWAH